MKRSRMLYLCAESYILWGLLCMIVSGEVNYIVLFRWAVFVPLFIIAFNLPNKNAIRLSLIAVGIVQSIVVIMQQAGVIANHNPFFRLTGFIRNPGAMGGFQAIAMTAGAICLKKRHYVIPLSICSALIIYSIVASGSRAAWIAALSGAVLTSRKPISTFLRSHRWGIAVLISFCISCAAVLYLIRPESADARLLVWRTSLGIICDNPIFGIGPGQFRSAYMLYQADFFAQHPLSRYAFVADNAAYPYNEFIRIAVEQGIIGLGIFLLTVYAAVENSSDPDAVALLTALLLFSCFSFPIDKPATAVLFPILFGACGKGYDGKTGKILASASGAVLLLFSICIFAFRADTKKDIERMRSEYDEGAEEGLEHRLPHIYTDIRFNSDYFCLVWKYAEMRQDTLAFIFLLPTCENWCDVGKFYYATGNDELAEKYFREAAAMIPTRLLPKYYLWKILKRQNKKDEAERMAKIIIKQPVKVENTITLRIRQEVKKSL